MPSLEQHCQECQEKLGNRFEEVNLWLDELFAAMGPKHRDVRHHQGGVEEVRKKWGDLAAEAAKLHIIADIGYVPTEQQAKIWSMFS